MFKSMIVKVLVLPAMGGAYLAGAGELPTLPTTDTAPPAATAPAPAPSSQGGIQVIATCEDPQDTSRAAQAPGQARKASPRTVTVQVPQAAAQAPQAVAQAPAAAAPAPSSQVAPQTAPQAPTAAPSADGRVNVNTATDAELDKVPGIGTATVAKIKAARPLASVDAVDALPGVNAENFALMKDRITV